jgi:hypothetical protein
MLPTVLLGYVVDSRASANFSQVHIQIADILLLSALK